MISNKYLAFSTESERKRIFNNLEQIEEWLYEDGAHESVDVYTEKLDYLTKLFDPIENRYKEVEARAHASKGLLDCIRHYLMVVGSLPAGERDMVVEECNKAEQWLQEKTGQQISLPKNVDPTLWSIEIKRKTEALDMYGPDATKLHLRNIGRDKYYVYCSWTCKHKMRSNASPPSPMDADDSDPRDKPDCISMEVD
ncbi:Heat shock 70 kDa protein 16 [Morella rubra]|uniref:Heat shock 70 kDa protein 16 n=1 Tax=Morella rubra TaxID=262757 RepID=A0A6A1UH47_9ROSI|nr:Heat shock 70 kDa protein 16 [Morella rubra]